MKTMANRIEQALLDKNGGNQSEMARYVGVSPQAVQKWIAGIAEPRGKNLKKASEFLGVSEPFLKFGAVTGWPAPNINPTENSRQPSKLAAVPYSQPPSPIDYDTLRDAIKFAIEDSETFRDKFSPELMARFIVMYYQLFKEDKKQLEKTKIDTILQLMAA